MGNICRSPTAEGVFRKLIVGTPLEDRVEIDSAATHDYQIGAAPDVRATHHAARRGIDLTSLRARQVTTSDFRDFDYVLAMDEQNPLRVYSSQIGRKFQSLLQIPAIRHTALE